MRFRDDDAPEGGPDNDDRRRRRREQYVPTDWIDVPEGEEEGEPLPDNAMHRAPYPTVHVIANADLASLRARDVSRVKRINARRMAELGWEGLERPTTTGGGGTTAAARRGRRG